MLKGGCGCDCVGFGDSQRVMAVVKQATICVDCCCGVIVAKHYVKVAVAIIVVMKMRVCEGNFRMLRFCRWLLCRGCGDVWGESGEEGSEGGSGVDCCCG